MRKLLVALALLIFAFLVLSCNEGLIDLLVPRFRIDPDIVSVKINEGVIVHVLNAPPEYKVEYIMEGANVDDYITHVQLEDTIAIVGLKKNDIPIYMVAKKDSKSVSAIISVE